jgi:hypothetical protein
MEKTKDGQRLIPDSVNDQIATVRTNDLEQGYDGAHARTVDQTQPGQVNDDLRWSRFAHLGDDRSELDNRERIQLTFNPKDGNAILCIEMEEHAIFR